MVRLRRVFARCTKPRIFRFRRSGMRNSNGVEGDLLFMKSQILEAEVLLQQALKIARDQGARSLELRAAISLSRVWKYQDRTEEASQLLSGTYSSFTEGFETSDLKRARSQLQQITLSQNELRESHA